MLKSDNEGKLCEVCGIGYYTQTTLELERDKEVQCNHCSAVAKQFLPVPDDGEDRLMILG